ncbi:MAG: alpha/beta fold hydrolase [Alphaproteobacteria bacterium]
MSQTFSNYGFETRYDVSGEGPAVILIHGVGSSRQSWDGVVERLEGYQTLRYDLRGHGGSGKPAGPYTLDDFVADLAALLDHVGIAKGHVVGFSLGGLIAQGFALAHGDRVDKLVLISTVSGRTDEERERVKTRLEMVQGGIPGAHFRKSMDRWFTPAFQAANPDLIDRLEAANQGNDPKANAAAYRVLAISDLAERLPEITAETLVMTGEDDLGSNPRMARLMHDRIANSQLNILAGLRHSILNEAPDTVAAALREFL